jgi:hypothetical protein
MDEKCVAATRKKPLPLESCLNVSNFIDENMNTKDKVWEILTPKIPRPPICENTGITA